MTAVAETNEPGGDATARSARLRHLIVTVYGLYARSDGGWLSVAALIRLLADLVLRERFCALRSRGAAVIAVAEITGAGTGGGGKTGQAPGWGPVRTGLVIDAVATDHNDLTGHDLYVAGPTAMVDALLAALVRTRRAAADRVFFDRFWT